MYKISKDNSIYKFLNEGVFTKIYLFFLKKFNVSHNHYIANFLSPVFKEKKMTDFFCYFISYFFKRNFIRACLSFFSKVKTFTIQRGSQMQLKKMS